MFLKSQFKKIKEKGLLKCLFPKKYEILEKEYIYTNYDKKNYLKFSKIIKEYSFIDKIFLKDIIIKNLNKGYKPLIILNELYNEHPILYNKNYLTKIHIKTKSRLFYFLEDSLKNNENFIMKVIKKENKVLKNIKNLDSIVFRQKKLSLYELVPENFKIKKDFNKFLIKNFYPKYIFLISGIVYKNELKKFFKKTVSIEEEMIEKIHSKIIFKEDKLYFLKELSINDSYKRNIITKYFKYEYIDNFYLLENLKNLFHLNFLDLSLEDTHITDISEEIKLKQMYPNLMVYDTLNYRTKTKFIEMLEILIKEYTEYKKERNIIVWNLKNNQLMSIVENITENLLKYNEFNDLINIETMTHLLKIDLSFFCDFYFKNKYSKKMISNLRKNPKIILNDNLEGIDNITKELCIQYAYLHDLKEMKPNEINNLINDIDFAFRYACEEFFNNNKIDKEEKLKLLKQNPKLAKIYNISNVLEKEDILRLINENHLIYRYCYDRKIKEDEEISLKAIEKNVKNIKNVSLNLLIKTDIPKKILSINKRYIDAVLKMMTSDKSFDYKNIEDNILNEYLRTENDKYLKYLPEEIIETYLFLNKINIEEIKDKKSLKKVKKIANNMEDLLD